MLHETVTALTDLGLTLECAWFTASLYAQPTRWFALRTQWILFYGSIGFAAGMGGVIHRFFPDDNSAGSIFLWPFTLIAIGVTGLAAWSAGAELLFAPSTARKLRAAATGLFTCYCIVIWKVTRDFSIAIVYYVPAVVFLAGALGWRRVRRGERGLGLGALGGVLTLVASALQQERIGLHPVWLDYNALYHLLEAAAIYMVFRSSRVTVAS
jgi:hypothetical protein